MIARVRFSVSVKTNQINTYCCFRNITKQLAASAVEIDEEFFPKSLIFSDLKFYGKLLMKGLI